MKNPEEVDNQGWIRVFSDPDAGLQEAAAIAGQHGFHAQPQRIMDGSHLVFRIGDWAWLKLAPRFMKEAMEAEVNVLQRLSQTSLPIPKILGKGTFRGWSYLMISHVPGDEDARPSMHGLYQVSQAILQWHCLKPPVREFGSWLNWLDFCEESGVERLMRPGVSRARAATAFQWLSQQMPRLRDLPTGLIHCDLIPEHVRFDDRGYLCGILDFADCQEGPLHCEAAIFFYCFLPQQPLEQREFCRWLNIEADPELFLALLLVDRFLHLNGVLGRYLRVSDDYGWIARRIFAAPCQGPGKRAASIRNSFLRQMRFSSA